MIESIRSVSKGTAIGVGFTWVAMFVIGLIMIFVPLKRRDEGEMNQEDAKNIIIPGAIIFALSLLFATGILITVGVTVSIAVLTSTWMYFKNK